MQRICFIGFVVMPYSVGIELKSIQAIEEWPEPSCHCDIQVFLGFANFYRCFISAFSKISKPMTDMLKGGRNGRFHGPFVPSAAMQQSFRQLKAAFTSAPVLVHFDPVKSIRLETDASGYAIASIILQQMGEVWEATEGLSNRMKHVAKGHWHPVAFWSRNMSSAERNYMFCNSEMLAFDMS